MGDVLHALPAVAGLRRRFPNAFIGWAIEPLWADLLQIAEDPEDITQGVRWQVKAMVDRWYSVPTKAWKRRPLAPSTRREILAVRNVIRAEHFDHCIDLQGSIKSAVIGRMAKAPVFAGFAEPREEFARRLYTDVYPAIGDHVVQQNCNLIGAVLGEEIQPAPVTLPMQELAERWAEDTVGSQPFCLISPGGGWGAKLWPAERFGNVAAQLGRAGIPSIVNASPSGSPEADAVAASSFDHARVVPCSIAQLIALVRRAAVVVGGDTGPIHLAAALQRPVVAIFGPTDPARNGPYGGSFRVLRAPDAATNYSRRSASDGSMRAITPRMVAAALMEALESKSAGCPA